MKKIISILTATRAEYGLLKPVIEKLNMVKEFDVRIAVTGMHLSPEFGLTYRDIENDGFAIDKKIEILLGSDTPASISKSMGLAMIGFGEYFEDLKPDLLIVLGDRYETLSVCCAAVNARIPIAHLYGGETTEGAIDECMRHAITKMSYLHFTSTEEYRRRVIQMGEAPDRVITAGALGVENIRNLKLLTKTELEEAVQFTLDKPYALVTFHPVTLEENNAKEQFRQLLKALSTNKDMKFIFTKANSDANGRIINELIDKYVSENANSRAFASLGSLRYLSALKYCSIVIGNSSSGLIEAPSFQIPTINIGDRQKGRLQSTSVINCRPDQYEIENAVSKAKSTEFREIAKHTVNPYGDGNSSDKIIDTLKDTLFHNKINIKKQFYNINCEEL
jgi:GDP/UDP-N,N'-diacetylbacillosamine 2-epimerase (hydrolysing)